MADDGEPTPIPTTRWQRFLAGKTGVQRFVLAVGALAAAVLAVSGVIAGVGSVVGRISDSGSASGERTIENQSDAANSFVRTLLSAEDRGEPLQLDHKVLAPRGQGGEYRLEYNCVAGTCNYVRLETPTGDPPAAVAGGGWYQGCWSVTRDGNGYGADHLDIELVLQGATCP